MTAQTDDLFRYRETCYPVAGISRGELFHPSELGLKPVGVSTACWRGYQAVFALSGSHLVLDELHVNLYGGVEGAGGIWLEGMEPMTGPAIKDVWPVTPAETPTESPPRSFDEWGFPVGWVDGSLVEGSDDDFNNHYTGLEYPLAYTGGVLLATDFCEELYVHMGFHPAWKYETVIELVFDAGMLLKESDRSEEMAQLRARLRASPQACVR